MSEFTELLDQLGEWEIVRFDLIEGIKEGRDWTQPLIVASEIIHNLREQLAELEWDYQYEDHYAHIVDVEPQPVDEWELLPTYEPSHIHKMRMPVAA